LPQNSKTDGQALERDVQKTTSMVSVKKQHLQMMELESATSANSGTGTVEHFSTVLLTLHEKLLKYLNPFPIVHPVNGSLAIV
jgi:hypothetical protein